MTSFSFLYLNIVFTPKPNCVYVEHYTLESYSEAYRNTKIIGQQKLLRGANFRTKEGLLKLSK